MLSPQELLPIVVVGGITVGVLKGKTLAPKVMGKVKNEAAPAMKEGVDAWKKEIFGESNSKEVADGTEA